MLYKEGDRGREFFVLVEGKVDVARKGRRVAALGAGDFVGEISLLEQTPRTATVTAKIPLRLFVLTPRDFRQRLSRRSSQMAESMFGHTKHSRGMGRFHRRGRSAARTEWRLITATHNLLKPHSHTPAPATA